MEAGARAALILCIEDEGDLREMLAEELEDAGYAVLTAADGEAALALLATERPDLILCDIAMPEMDGYALLGRIRETMPALDDVPFVFLSAQDASSQITQGKQAGADDYLVKPVDFDLMLATIAARLRQVRRMRESPAGPEGDMEGAIRDEAVRKAFDRTSRTFDLVASAIVLLNGRGEVRFANVAARRLAAEDASPAFTRMLDEGGAQGLYFSAPVVQEAVAAGRDGREYTGFLSLRRQDGQRDLLATVCTLGEAARAEDDVAAALFIFGGSRDEPAPVKALQALFQLTPAEGRIAWAFAQGMRPDEIAASFEISATTVAFHKRNIFQKTRTNRQADLIALLLTLPAITRGSPWTGSPLRSRAPGPHRNR